MKFAGYNFRPALVPTLATLLGIALLIFLATWQLQRGHQKSELIARQLAGLERPAQVLNRTSPKEYSRFQAIGEYQQQQFLLDNKTRKGEPGYEVLTPFKLRNSSSLILVNRGWVSWGQSRQQKPDVTAPLGEVSLQGLWLLPSRGFTLGEMLEPSSEWPHRVQYIDYQQLSDLYGELLQVGVLRLESDQVGSLRADWPSLVPLTPSRHYGYALTWFCVAMSLLIFYLAANTTKE